MFDTSIKRIPGPAIRLNPADNVLVARMPIGEGVMLPGDDIVTRTPVPSGYKVAARDLKRGEAIRKYDTVIGYATADIQAGTMLHSHNIELKPVDVDFAYASEYRPVTPVAERERAMFQGFLRPDGRAGTRNYIAVVATVNCSASVVHAIADHFTKERLAAFPHIDGVAAFAHGTGCGMEMSGEPMALLHRTLAGYIRHPNVAAALVIGLGCERCQVGGLFAKERLETGARLRSLVMQEYGGTRRTVEAGIAMVKEMLPEANAARRTTLPASHIVVGLQCGGSDGFSSISANPALGAAVDILARHRGTCILSETPEIRGVEHMLTRRAASREVGEKLIERVRWWLEDYTKGRDVQIQGTVSPGNQAGGLANIFEKSLGSAMKGGTGPLMQVYRYAEPVTEKGLVFMDTPGFDPVSATGQIAGGANLIAFTTGRGSCFGSAPAPSIKLATNTPMYRRMEEDMDINCGDIVDGGATIEEMGQRIFDLMLRVASGERTKSEQLGLGRHEFVPWNIGVVG